MVKKFFVFFLIVGVVIALLWLLLHHKRDYEIEYSVDGFQVTETFNVESNHYYLKLQKDDKVYETYLNLNYSPKRKMVNKVELFSEKDMYCIQINNELLEYPICKLNDEYVSYYISKENQSELKNTFNNIEIYNLLNKTFLIWNYKGFYYVNDEKLLTLNLFSRDVYMPYLITKNNEVLFIANYDEEYEFSKYIIINSKKGSVKEHKLDTKISTDSYILGEYKNSIYLVDRKKEQEYEINLKKSKIYKTGGKVLKNQTWEKVDIEKLVKKDIYFQNDELISFQLIDKKVYYVQGDIKTRVANLNVDYIIDYNDTEVYFIANGIIYNFNITNGLTKIMKYSEWNFNYNNCVFVF